MAMMDNSANDEAQPRTEPGRSGEPRAQRPGYETNGADDLRAGTRNDPASSAADADPGDMSVRDKVADPGSYQSNHGTTGNGGDDERGDHDDAKVTGQSRGRG